ncbi:MAG: HU family DNA-binding protein [Kiritimatiellae bacterium]|nr:HU family DNA-binding protein [Kiritimatiellia bacterium]
MPRKTPGTKLELVRALSLRADISQTAVRAVLDALVAYAYAGASSKRGFSVPGLGRVKVIRRKARLAVNPSSGERVMLPAHPALAFRFSDDAKKAILGSARPCAGEPVRAAAAGARPKPPRRPRKRRSE